MYNVCRFSIRTIENTHNIAPVVPLRIRLRLILVHPHLSKVIFKVNAQTMPVKFKFPYVRRQRPSLAKLHFETSREILMEKNCLTRKQKPGPLFKGAVSFTFIYGLGIEPRANQKSSNCYHQTNLDLPISVFWR